MKPEPSESEKYVGKDLETFEQLPAKTKELVILKDQAENVTGPESVALDRAIRE